MFFHLLSVPLKKVEKHTLKGFIGFVIIEGWL